MLKRSAILRSLLVAILSSVFLLIIGGTVNASDEDVIWPITDVGNLIFDQVGGALSGKGTNADENIKWEATILETDGKSSGSVYFRFTDLSNISGTITIPDYVQYTAGTIKWSYKVVKIDRETFASYNSTKKTYGTEPKNITGIVLNKFIGTKIGCTKTSCSEDNTCENCTPLANDAFESCTSLKKITVKSANTKYKSVDGVLYKGNKLVKFPINKEISNFNIPTTVQVIGDYAFSNHSATETSILIPSSVMTLGDYAFYNFKGLKSISFQDESKITELGGYCFANCTSLEKFPELSKITTIKEGAFGNCTKLNEVIIGNSVTKIESHAFRGTNISQIKLPDSVKTIGDTAFYQSSLEEIDLNKVETIGSHAFRDCLKLKTVTLSSNLTGISNNLFYNCRALTSINLNDKIVSIGDYAFYNTAIEKMELPETVTSIGSNVFLGNTKLTSIVIPSATAQVGSNVFYNTNGGCNDNLVVYCTSGNKIISQAPAYIVYEKSTTNDFVTLNKFTDVKGKVTQIDLLNEIYGLPVTVIGEGAFKDNVNLKSITIPDTVTEIKAEAFSGCTGITDLILPLNLKKIGNKALYNCSGMQSIVIKKGTVLEDIGAAGTPETNAFTNCTAKIYHDGVNTLINGLSNQHNVIIDSTPPTATYVKERVNGNYYITMTLKNINDNASGAYKYAITFKSNPTEITNEEWKYITGTTASEVIKANGTIYMYIQDRVGNIATYSAIINEVDTGKPEILSNSLDIEGGKIATVKVKVKDNNGGSGLDSYIWSLTSNVANVTNGWEKIAATGTEVTITKTFESSGTYYLTVKDKAGNLSESMKIEIDHTKIDSNAPVLNMISSNISINKETDKVNYEVVKYGISDSGVGLAGYAVDQNDTTSENTRWINLEGNPATSEFEYQYESNGTFYIHIKDAYNNIISIPYEENKIEEDSISPKVQIADKKGNEVEVILSDSNSGIAAGANIGYAWVKQPNEEPSYQPANLQYTNGAKEVSFKVDGSSLTGDYYLKIKIVTLKDVEGNEYVSETENQNFVISEAAYKFDNTAPTLSFQISKASIKEDAITTYTITSSEKVILNKEIKPSLNDANLGTLGTLTYSGNTSDDNVWTITLTASSENGDVILNLPKEIFTDESGNVLDKDYKVTGVKVDNTAPELPAPTLNRATVNNEGEAIYTFELSEKLAVVESKKELVTLTGTGISGSIVDIAIADINGKAWAITVKGGTGNGEVALNLPAGLFIDEAGNESKAQTITGLSFDNIAPTLSIEGPTPTIINKDGTAKFTITSTDKLMLSEGKNVELNKVNAGDTVNGGQISVTNKTEDGKTLEVAVTNVLGDGEAKITIAEGVITDEAGNKSPVTEKAGLIIDNTAPVISSVSEPSLSTDKASAIITITTEEKEDSYVLSVYDDLEKVTENWKTANSTTLTETVKSNGEFYAYVKDKAGNIAKYNNAITVTGVIDNIVPTIQIEDPEPKILKAGETATFKITASESVTKAENINATVTGEGNTVVLTGEKTNWLATVTAGNNDGEVELVLPRGLFKDTSNNSSEETKKAGLKVDNTLPEVEVEYEQTENGIKVIIIGNEELEALEGWTLTKTNKDNDTLVKEITSNLSEVIIKDKAGNEISVPTNVKFATSISLSATETLDINVVKDLSATLVPTDVTPESIKWTSSDNSIVTVDANGVIKGIKSGVATITATSVIDKTITSSCQVTVSNIVYKELKGISFAESTLEVAEGYSKKLTVTFSPSDATNKNVTWSSDNTNIATVDAEGKVTGLALGEATITATSVEGGYIASCKVTVVEAVPVTKVELDNERLDLNVGDSAVIKATVTPENATSKELVWSSDNENVATVNNNGKVVAVGAGTATITVISKVDGIFAECSVVVKESTKVDGITLSKTSVDIIEGSDIILEATIAPANATNKNVTWSSNNENVATVDAQGKVTAVAEGTAIITVTTQDGNKTATCTVNVKSDTQESVTGFKADSGLTVEIVGGITYLTGVEAETTIENISSKVEAGYEVSIEDAEGNKIENSSEFVTTGNTKILITKENVTITYVVVVKGDCTSDGQVTALDLIGAVRQYKYVKSEGTKGKALDGAKLLAIKFTETNEYTARDLIGEVRIYKEWKNK